MTLLDLARVFAKGHVANVMRSVFDRPVAPIAGQQRGGVRLIPRSTGDRVSDFVLFFTAYPPPTLDAADLGHARPIEMFGQSRGSLQTTPLATAVPFAAGFSHRQLRLPLTLGVGGKRPAETRLRWLA